MHSRRGLSLSISVCRCPCLFMCLFVSLTGPLSGWRSLQQTLATVANMTLTRFNRFLTAYHVLVHVQHGIDGDPRTLPLHLNHATCAWSRHTTSVRPLNRVSSGFRGGPPRTKCLSLISAPVATAAQREPAASRVLLSRIQSDLADAAGKSHLGREQRLRCAFC